MVVVGGLRGGRGGGRGGWGWQSVSIACTWRALLMITSAPLEVACAGRVLWRQRTARPAQGAWGVAPHHRLAGEEGGGRSTGARRQLVAGRPRLRAADAAHVCAAVLVGGVK